MTSIWGLFLSGWTDRRTQFRSSLTAEQCMLRLREDFGGLLGGGSGSVRGWMLGRTARLTRHIVYRNSFQTVVSVSVADRGGGAVIDAAAGVALSVRIFMMLWFSFLVLFAGFAILAVASGSPVDGDWTLFLTVPGAMMLFGVALVVGCRYLARDDEGVILAYVRRRLEVA